MKFVLLVEGDAEYKALPAFLKRWLDPQLRLPVGIKAVNMGGLSEYLKEAPKRARMYLDGPDGADIVAVIGLIDLYGPTIYPAHLETPEERRTWLTNRMETEVGRAKFRQFYWADYAGGDKYALSPIQGTPLVGKIALIQRGGNTFTEKINNAELADFSSWGPTPNYTLKPDVAAPGVNFYSSVPGGKYEVFRGTSMATPHVAGSAALLLVYSREHNLGWGPAEVKAALMGTAHDAADTTDPLKAPVSSTSPGR